MSKAWLHWIILLLISAAVSAVLLWFHIPAALLLGPLIGGITLSLCGSSLHIPRFFFLAAQAVIGCMIAGTLSPAIFPVLFGNWPIVLLILFSTLGASAFSGWMLVRYSALPGVTGAWGTSPGGASAMVAMARDYGADVRLVAFMQYLRVLFVAGAAVMVVRFSLGDEAQALSQEIVWFPPLTGSLLLTMLMIVVTGWLGRISRFPSGTMFLPMLVGAALHTSGTLSVELPEWLLALAYMAIGWSVGLEFNRAIFVLALKTLPQMLAAIFAMMLLCALMALALTHVLGLDMLTAYLATSPGGLDTVAIIAAGSRADMSFIMAMQTLRLFSILLTGPAIARFISRHAVRVKAVEKNYGES